MKRFAVVTGVFLAFGLIMIFAESCGNREQILDPTEHQQQSFLTTSVGSEHELLEEGSLLVFIPKTGDAREIYDPWISVPYFRCCLMRHGGFLSPKGQCMSMTLRSPA